MDSARPGARVGQWSRRVLGHNIGRDTLLPWQRERGAGNPAPLSATAIALRLAPLLASTAAGGCETAACPPRTGPRVGRGRWATAGRSRAQDALGQGLGADGGFVVLAADEGFHAVEGYVVVQLDRRALLEVGRRRHERAL